MDGENPKGLPKATLRELLAFAGPQRATLVLVGVMGILGTLAALAQPLAVSSDHGRADSVGPRASARRALRRRRRPLGVAGLPVGEERRGDSARPA